MRQSYNPKLLSGLWNILNAKMEKEKDTYRDRNAYDVIEESETCRMWLNVGL